VSGLEGTAGLGLHAPPQLEQRVEVLTLKEMPLSIHNGNGWPWENVGRLL
jgi:hypothetical protein